MNRLDENRFTMMPMEEDPQEEIFAEDWEALIGNHAGMPWQVLRDMFVELDFPVCKGQSENPELLAAMKQGIRPAQAQEAWAPAEPEKIFVYLQKTPIGRIPVIECGSDKDFIHLQRCLIYRCEPRHVPDSRGATILKNYNNWARIKMHQGGMPDVLRRPEYYRDYIILLSHRYYSGVAPEVFGLGDVEWREKSLVLRREHEIAHYLTQRYYHSSKNELHDELIADFMGLTAAFGDYDPAKFFAFLGLENYPDYRKGGRLELYLQTDEEDISKLGDILMRAAENVAIHYQNTGRNRMNMFHALCRTSVAGMARGDFT